MKIILDKVAICENTTQSIGVLSDIKVINKGNWNEKERFTYYIKLPRALITEGSICQITIEEM